MKAPDGYRLVRIGQRGRKPVLEHLPTSQLTNRQLQQLNWRQKNVEQRREYNKQYYLKKKKESASTIRK